jgi:hypothetical protein
MWVTDDYGNKTEAGYKSEIIGVSLKDNPDAVRGKRGVLILWEEAGTFAELKAAWQIARPSVEHDGVAFVLNDVLFVVILSFKLLSELILFDISLDKPDVDGESFETKINVEIIEESVDILVELSPDNDVDKELSLLVLNEISVVKLSARL